MDYSGFFALFQRSKIGRNDFKLLTSSFGCQMSESGSKYGRFQISTGDIEKYAKNA